MSRIAIVYHSGYSHTKVQAEDCARDIDAADAIMFGAPTYTVRVLSLSRGSSRTRRSRRDDMNAR